MKKNYISALKVSPNRGDVGCADRGVLAGQRQVSTAVRQQARSGGEPVEENAFPQMSFIGVDRYCSSVGTGDSALEHRRWLKFGLGTDAKT